MTTGILALIIISAIIVQIVLFSGVSSNYLHDHIHEGDRLLVNAPDGHFHLMENESLPRVLVGGGIGVTPPKSNITLPL